MKKNLIQSAKTITLGTIAAMAVTITACNDDISLNDAACNAVSSSIDAFGCGCRLLSVTSSNISEERIPVNSKDIQLSNSNSLFNYRITEDGGKYYIVPAMSCSSSSIENDVLTLTKKDGSAEKDILITYTPESMKTRAASAENGVEAAVVSAMTKGFIPGKIAPDAQVTECLFGKQRLFDVDACAERDFESHLLTVNTDPYGDYFYEKATDRNEVAKSNARSAGFNLAVPVYGANVSIGFEASKSTTNKTVREHETAMYGFKCRRASGSMDIDFLSDYFAANENKDNKMSKFISETVDAIMAKGVETDRAKVTKDVKMALSLQTIMNGTACKVLNNTDEGSPYHNYDNNDEDDMRALISKYGMYIGTGCQVGGMVQTTLDKESSSSEMTMEEAVKLTVEATASQTTKQTETDTEEKKDGEKKREIKGVIEKVPATPSAKFSFSNTNKLDELQSALKISFRTQSWGGNQVNDIEKWDLGSNAADLTVISFAAKDVETKNSESSDDGFSDNRNFIPLWKLCIDPDRREALRKLIEPDGQNKIGYYNYTNKAKRTLVIADMKLKVYNNINDVKPVYDYDSRPNGKQKHLYIPMRCNEKYIDGQTGAILDFAKWQNIGESAKYKDYITKSMVALVAYEYVYDDDVTNKKDYTGIIGLDMGGKVSGNQVRSGDDTFFMTTGHSCFDRKGDHFLLVRYASSDTPMSERFKGVGFFYTKDDHNDNHKYDVFGSSLGTDWDSNYGQTLTDYKAAWGGSFVNREVGSDKHFFEAEIYIPVPFVDNAYVETAKKIYPCATTNEVTRDVEAEIAKIVTSTK